MRSNTQTISIDSPADKAFSLVADPGNLPRWAIGFAKAIEPDGDLGYIATTGQGRVPLRVATDARLGVVDFHLTVADGVHAVANSRVLPRGEGASTSSPSSSSRACPTPSSTARSRPSVRS